MTLRIKLSWPPSALNPNKRLHWGEKLHFANLMKRTWMIEAKGILGRPALPKGASKFKVTFSPPDTRRRDVDNCISSCKHLVDTLSAISGVDDSQFEITWPRKFSEPTRGGAVIVEVLS